MLQKLLEAASLPFLSARFLGFLFEANLAVQFWNLLLLNFCIYANLRVVTFALF